MQGLSTPLAIKFLFPSAFQSPKAKSFDRFLREAQALYSLRHQYIPTIFGLGKDESMPFILMEYFKNGQNLQKIREKKENPNPLKVMIFFRRIAEALALAHDSGWVHRDIKPTNLMASSNDARLLDFGVALKIDPNNERITSLSGAIGGDSFSSPELIANPMLENPQTDIYSLGACWFWLLTGQSPNGLNWERLLRTNVDVSKEYEAIILKCLSPLEQRYNSCFELINDISYVIEGKSEMPKPNILTENDKKILGVIFNLSLDDTSGCSFYNIEKQLGKSISRFGIGISTHKMMKQGIIEKEYDQDFNGHPYYWYKLTSFGDELIQLHSDEIESALNEVEATLESQEKEYSYKDGDVPF